MKKRWLILGAVLLAGSLAWGADSNIRVNTADGSTSYLQNLRDRGNGTYAPTVNAESNFSYSHLTSTTVVSGSAGFFHTLSINKAAAQAFIVYDSTHTGDTTRPIASFAASAGPLNFDYDVQVTSGILVICPASGPDMTLSYR